MNRKLGLRLRAITNFIYRQITTQKALFTIASLIVRKAPSLYSVVKSFTSILPSEGPPGPIAGFGSTHYSSESSWQEEILKKRDNLHKFRKVQFRFGNHVFPKPRIAIITPIPPARTGVAQFALDLAKELSKFYSVYLVAESLTPDIQESPELRKFRLEYLTQDQFLRNINKFAVSIFQIGNSPFHIFQHKLFFEVGGVLDLHEFYLNGLVGQIHLAEPTSNILAQHIITSSGYQELAQRLADEASGKPPSDTPANLMYLQAASRIIVHNFAAEKLIRQNYQIVADEKITVIPLARARREITSNAHHSPDRRENVLKGVTFGFLTSNKAILEIIGGLIKFAETFSHHLEYTFVGECIDEGLKLRLAAALKQIPPNLKITITGWVDDDKYFWYLENFDFAVQVRKKTFGESSATALDASLTGKPVIVNAPETLQGLSRNNLIFIPDEVNSERICFAINSLLEDGRLQEHESQVFTENVHDLAERALEYKKIIDALTVPKNRYIALSQARKNATSVFHETSPRKKQLFVDVTSINTKDHGTGIQRTVKALVEEFLRTQSADLQISPVYYSIEKRRYLHAANFSLKTLGMPDLGLKELPIDPNPGDVFLGLDLTGADFYESELIRLKRHGVKVAFVLYDILPLLLPQHFQQNSVTSFRNWLQMVCKFDGVFAISESVKNDFAKYLAENRIAVPANFFVGRVQLGSNFDATPSNHKVETLSAEHIAKSFSGKLNFLMVGTLEPRKGHKLILKAFEHLWDKGFDCNLNLVGKAGWLVEDLIYTLEGHRQSGNKLNWLKYVSDEQLEECYSRAECLILASEGEGFGLPIIEAARRGVPLLLRDIPIFREVGKDGASFFSSTQPEQVAVEIENWIRDYEIGRIPRSKNIPSTTWSTSAEAFMMEIRNRLF